MGAWGEYPLENDTALDLMSYLTKVNNKTLGRMIGLMLNSRDEFESVLGIFLVDVYYNGVDDDLNLYDYNSWFGILHKSKNETLEFHCDQGYTMAALVRALDNVDKWKDKSARLKVLDDIKKRLTNCQFRKEN